MLFGKVCLDDTDIFPAKEMYSIRNIVYGTTSTNDYITKQKLEYSLSLSLNSQRKEKLALLLKTCFFSTAKHTSHVVKMSAGPSCSLTKTQIS